MKLHCRECGVSDKRIKKPEPFQDLKTGSNKLKELQNFNAVKSYFQ